MKNVALAIVLVAIATSVSLVSAYYYLHKVASTTNYPSMCSDPSSISSHVYHPYRLRIVKPCITASGIVANVTAEADGDYHLKLVLDSQYSNLTNSANDYYQYGDLVVEIICGEQLITQQDAVAACQDYTNNIIIPSINDNITVTGPYVLDTDHYNWAEIHPVYSLTITQSSSNTQ